MTALTLGDILGLFKAFGFPAVILVLWWVDSKRMQRLERIIDEYKGLCERYAKTTDEFLQMMALNIQSLSRIEQKIEDNRFCPVVRREMEAR